MVTITVIIPFDYSLIDYSYQTLDLMFMSIMVGCDIYLEDGFNDLIEDRPYLGPTYISLKSKATKAMYQLYKCSDNEQIKDLYMGTHYLIDAKALGNSTCLIFKDTEA